MSSPFRICITRADDEPVYLRPGSSGERDLVLTIRNHIMAKGVGFFRTAAQVETAVREGVAEALYALKAEVQPE
jgi:hypothetical protein